MGTINIRRRCAYHCLVLVRPFNTELWPLIMQYAYRATIVSLYFFCKYWLKFNETLYEQSISWGDAQIIALFESDSSRQSYGP
jgi:hypothetical protein